MVKQIIILRKDLNMSTGKAVAQGAHASNKAINRVEHFTLCKWAINSYAKIVLSCENEEELLKIHRKVSETELPYSIIKDEGRTEFNEPTFTCLAIGPAEAKEIDKITRRLKLY